MADKIAGTNIEYSSNKTSQGNNWVDTSNGESGHHSTHRGSDGVIKSYTHSPNDAKPNGFEYDPNTGRETRIVDGKPVK
ncbi:hypothetical protein BH11ARM2_BH11ARM2_32100 [soil metagenome]